MNIWQSYKQERGCLVHFERLANTLLDTKKVHGTITFLLAGPVCALIQLSLITDLTENIELLRRK